jgi:hypothetical protein
MVLVVLVIAPAIGQGIPNLLQANATEGVQFLAFSVIMAGLLVVLRWELLGGAAVLGGLAIFYALNVVANCKVPEAHSRCSSSPDCSSW